MSDTEQSFRGLVWMHDPFPGVRTGCNAIILRVVALPLLLIGGLLIWSEIRAFSLGMELGFGAILVLFGLVCWLGASNQKSMDFRFGVHIDADREELRLFKDDVAHAFAVPFCRIVGLSVRKEREAGGANDYPRIYFALYAVLDDGAELWLLSRDEPSVMADAVRSVQAILPVPTADRGRLGVASDGRAPEWSAPESLKPPEASNAVSITEDKGRTRIVLKHRRSWSERMIPGLVMAFFVSIPTMISLVACRAAIGDPHPFAVLGALLSVLVSGVLVFGMVLMMLTIWQDYRIDLTSSEVRVEQRFRIGLLQRYLGRTLTVAPDQVEGVRVNVGHGGHARLVMVVRGAPTVCSRSQILGAGAFRESLDGQSEIPLWKVDPGVRIGFGPGLRDLVHLEYFLQHSLQVGSESGMIPDEFNSPNA